MVAKTATHDSEIRYGIVKLVKLKRKLNSYHPAGDEHCSERFGHETDRPLLAGGRRPVGTDRHPFRGAGH